MFQYTVHIQGAEFASLENIAAALDSLKPKILTGESAARLFVGNVGLEFELRDVDKDHALQHLLPMPTDAQDAKSTSMAQPPAVSKNHPFDKKTLGKIRRLTKCNDHGAAYLVVAQALRIADIANELAWINDEHKARGDLSSDLYDRRYAAYKRLLLAANSKLQPETFAKLYRAL